MKKLKIVINLNDIAYNYLKVRKLTGLGENVIPVLKADAYGFGIANAAKQLLELNEPQKKFFVFDTIEGIELKMTFPQIEKIFVLDGLTENDVKYVKEFELTPVLNSYEQLEIANKNGIKDFALQFNTGMNRSGINMSEINRIVKYLDKNNLKPCLIMSHLCCADNVNSPVNQMQMKNFEYVGSFFPDKTILKSLSASSAILNFDTSKIANSCRPGTVLFNGYSGDRLSCFVYSYIESDGKNLYLPVGILNGFTSDYGRGDSYVLFNGIKIYVKSVETDRIILDTNDKKLIGAEVSILDGSLGIDELAELFNTSDSNTMARLMANGFAYPSTCKINITKEYKTIENYDNYKAVATFKNNVPHSFYSTILEKRIVDEDGICGYSATREVKKGDCLATFYGGFMDGISREISNTGSSVFVEATDGNYIECEIFARISMDQTIIKIQKKDFDRIKIGAKVIVFDENHPLERFETATKKTRQELFYYMDKSRRIKIIRE